MSLFRRLWTYQRERFPLAAYVPLITTFTLCAAAFSRAARGASGFISPELAATGVLTALVCFFGLRVLDEHKDADIDRVSRPELPVPRGLVTLAELRTVLGVGLTVVVALNAWLAPKLLVALAVAVVWAALMTAEFGVRDWLRAHMAAYLVSHMLIMPALDFYTTGLDWLAVPNATPNVRALTAFLVVTFLNGVVVEIGRKIRAPGLERPGVDTYSSAWGVGRATAVWLIVLLGAVVMAAVAAKLAGAGTALQLGLLIVAAAIAALPAVAFLRRPDVAGSKRIETAAGLWTIAVYLLLGLSRLF